LFKFELSFGRAKKRGQVLKPVPFSAGLRRDDTFVIQDVYQALLTGLADYVRKNRFRKVVIGLSGGIDSALVAAIARDALGLKSVIGVAMPGPYSSKHSFEDAKALAENLGIEFRTRPIQTLYKRFIHEAAQEKKKRSEKALEGRTITVAMENLQARLRALELMYLSNDEGAVLLTTGNKSELAMGYSTLYGDMCGGLSVIGDVYKTDVYRLARYRNLISKAIPESTFRKPPSAELRPRQKDQDSLPPYDILDRILYLYIEQDKSISEIAKLLRSKNISEKVVRWVIGRVDANEYKRRQLPPVLRITEKAWFGRRMPITNRFEK
jgi:NAD+ synthetase